MKTPQLIVATIMVLLSVAALAADVSGTWSGQFTSREGNAIEVTLNLKANGNDLTGTIGVGSMEDTPIENGKVNGDRISFSVTRHLGDQSRKINYTGKVEGNQLKLTQQVEGSQRTQDMTLTKK